MYSFQPHSVEIDAFGNLKNYVLQTFHRFAILAQHISMANNLSTVAYIGAGWYRENKYSGRT
jgi:hypothetical protein